MRDQFAIGIAELRSFTMWDSGAVEPFIIKLSRNETAKYRPRKPR